MTTAPGSPRADVYLNNFRCFCEPSTNSEQAIFAATDVKVFVNGGVFDLNTAASSAQILLAQSGSLWVLNSPVFVYSGSGNTFRYFRARDEAGAKIIGSAITRCKGTGTVPAMFRSEGNVNGNAVR